MRLVQLIAMNDLVDSQALHDRKLDMAEEAVVARAGGPSKIAAVVLRSAKHVRAGENEGGLQLVGVLLLLGLAAQLA